MDKIKFSKTVKALIVCLATATFLSFYLTPVWSADEANAARETMSKWQDVVITVKVITNLRMIVEGQEMNKITNETEVIATIIDPSGLAVLSNSNIDPNRIYKELFKTRAGEDKTKFDMETEITDIMMLMADGSDVPAKIVMKDSDLDLVFIRPKEKLSNSVHALDFSKSIKLDIADSIIILTRLGRSAGRIPSVSIHRIEAKIKRPRVFYVVDENTLSGKLGSPAFSLDGKAVGIFLLRVTESQGKGFSPTAMFGGASRLGLLPVILPSEEIMEVSKQAINAK